LFSTKLPKKEERTDTLPFFAWHLVLSKILNAPVKISCPSCCMETRDNTHSEWEVKFGITRCTL